MVPDAETSRYKMKHHFRFLSLAVVGFAGLLLAAVKGPAYFANLTYMGTLLVVEVVLACIWRFETVFFPVTMGCFFLAGTGLPLSAQSVTLRWVFLFVGAVVGFGAWMRIGREHRFASFHLIAMFCVLAAVASASASNTPATGVLKAASLFLLFLYAATGVRAALAGREKSFVRALVIGCEILIFCVSCCYAAGFDMFGNPNNLGAFVGVIATPILLWGAMTAENRWQRQRRYIALGLCGVLLYVSVCRAAIIADLLLFVMVTIALRRPRTLVRVIFAGALLFEVMAVASPTHMTGLMDSLSGKFIYKVQPNPTQPGILGSRLSPWDDTVSAVKRHPWFGTGFGTSDLGEVPLSLEQSSTYTLEGSNREHGSSYLALAEYMGILGIVPFLALLLLVIGASIRVLRWMRHFESPSHYAVPFALVTIAGMIHAGFEDWLVAPGSYICVFFWLCAFLLIDLAPRSIRQVRAFAPHQRPTMHPKAVSDKVMDSPCFL
jgi:O-antigen ligase